ncbi:ribosomal large subunit pseudouridine synthase E [Nonlabens ulvanivorans]|nr:ribosomal large subunit pseudouridine synthase E [Nonlabens ulvanivorans]
MAVGRLDEQSEGLLLITTDGQLSHHINKSGKVDKEYAALVDGLITEQAITQLQNGVTISINGSAYDTKLVRSRNNIRLQTYRIRSKK